MYNNTTAISPVSLLIPILRTYTLHINYNNNNSNKLDYFFGLDKLTRLLIPNNSNNAIIIIDSFYFRVIQSYGRAYNIINCISRTDSRNA